MFKMKCIECKGRVIEDRELVCSTCGLVQGPILQSKYRSPSLNTNESIYRKENRERKIMAEIRHKELTRKNYQAVRIWKETYLKLKVHCNKHKIIMADFASKAIMEYIEKVS